MGLCVFIFSAFSGVMFGGLCCLQGHDVLLFKKYMLQNVDVCSFRSETPPAFSSMTVIPVDYSAA